MEGSGQAWAEAPTAGGGQGCCSAVHAQDHPHKERSGPNANSAEAGKPGFEGRREGKTGSEVVEVEAGPARQAALEIVTGISQKNRNNNHSSS